MDTITIIGGGFSGIQAARAACRGRQKVRVRLIDESGYATMVPALPDVLSGRFAEQALARPLSELLPPECELIQERVINIDLDGKRVETSGRSIDYDALILCAGSTPAPSPWDTDVMPAYGVQTLTAAQTLREQIERRLSAGDRLSVVIAGGGYTGLETAVALRDGCGKDDPVDITVVDPAETLLTMITAAERERLLDFINAKGISVRTRTTISRVERGMVELSDGTSVSDPLLVWAGGMRGQQMLEADSAVTERDGRLIVNKALQLAGHPEVFAAGDLAALRTDEGVLRRAVNFSFYSGRTAGQNAARYLSGRNLKQYSTTDLGWIIPLGDESAGRLFGVIPVGGRFGTRLHYLMCGFRHFGPAQAWTFYSAALALRRRMNPLAVSSAQG